MHLKDVRSSIRRCLACLVDRNFHTLPKNTPRTGRDFKMTTRTKIASIENRKRKSRKRTSKKRTLKLRKCFHCPKCCWLTKIFLTKRFKVFENAQWVVSVLARLYFAKRRPWLEQTCAGYAPKRKGAVHYEPSARYAWTGYTIRSACSCFAWHRCR